MKDTLYSNDTVEFALSGVPSTINSNMLKMDIMKCCTRKLDLSHIREEDKKLEIRNRVDLGE